MKHEHSRRLWRSSAVAVAITGAVFAGSALAAGNSVRVKLQGTPKAGKRYGFVITGNAVRNARLYLFVDYVRCGPNPAVEHARANGNIWTVRGRFTRTSTGWSSKVRGADHACVYLTKRSAKRNGAHGVLAHAFLTYQVR